MSSKPLGDLIAARIKHLRKQARMPYAELSARLTELGQSIPRLGLARTERGERRLDVDEVVALAAALGVRPGDLFDPTCGRCDGSPPPGMVCGLCGVRADP